MIVDDIRNWEIHFKNPVWERVSAEIKLLNAHMPDGEKKIQDEDIILKVFGYETFAADDPRAELESHRRYIDIHTTIAGSERIDWRPASGLSAISSYSEEEDAIYYDCKAKPGARINMFPGIFAAFWPQDAHMPRIMTGEKPGLIRKAVFKINIDLF